MDYFLLPPLHVVRIDPPSTTNLQFESTFVVDEETQKEFKKISKTREFALAAASKNYSSASITAISEYLPLVLGLMNAAEKLPSNFSKYLRISWNSALSSGFFSTNFFSHYNWYYEVINILLLFGLLKRNLAHEKISLPNFDDSDTAQKESSELLREAAGIFDFIHDEICTKFSINLQEINEKNHFPELFPDTFRMLSFLCIAECQQIGLKKCVLKKVMQPLNLAKLAAGIEFNFDKANALTEKLKIRKNSGMMGGMLPSCINLNLVKYIEINKQIFQGISCHFMGLHYKNNYEWAKGCLYLKEAITIFDSTMKECIGIDNQKGKDPIENILKDLKTMRAIANDVHSEAITHNSYLFQNNEEKLEITPVESKMLVAPIKFILPEPLDIQIKQNNSMWCCIQ